ncbi:MAG TPA: hypothetical protein VG106_08990 [Vicinamibacterales bacterium]|nr:hypothetical protein [Vicinamibacterales bacterium]
MRQYRRLALLAPALTRSLAVLATVACEQSGTITGPRADDAPGPVQVRLPSLSYSAVDLGTLGGPFANARGINARGQVVGHSLTATGEEHAFLWTPATGMVDLGTLVAGRLSRAFAINNLGVAVGVAVNAAGERRAVLWTNAGEIRDLGAPEGFHSAALGINDFGVVVGVATSKVNADDSRALRWLPDGTMRDLGKLGGSFNASLNGINFFGDVIASIDAGPHFSRGLLIRRDGTTVDIGNLGGTGPQDGTLGRAISNTGEVTGITTTAAGAVRAFHWSEETGMRDIGALDPNSAFSDGSAINSLGMIVGSSAAPPFGAPHAFLWTKATGMRDLGTLGGPTSRASAINDLGQIVGTAEPPATPRRSHAILWQPALRFELPGR